MSCGGPGSRSSASCGPRATRRRARARWRSSSFSRRGSPPRNDDPRTLLVWYPLAKVVRQLFPEECAALDRLSGGPFPFTPDQVESAHARWTADWLAWERTHDADYKMKAAAVEHELAASGGSPVLRAKLDAVEREKLDLYQQHYSNYVRIAKALHALSAP